MGIPKLLFLRQLITKSTFQSFKPQYNSPLIFTQIRKITQLSTSCENSLHSLTVQFCANSPKKSIIPLLDDFEKVNVVKHKDLKNIIHTLSNKQLFDRALEVSEWMTSRSFSSPNSGDLAVRLDLTGRVHGVDAAERFFKKVDDHSERMYGALLKCYVKANLVDKSLSHFQVMKENGFITTAVAYNSIMSLYMKNGQVGEVPKLLIEMEENGISSDIISLKICLKSLAKKSDTTKLEKVLNIMENEPRRLMDWSTCCLIANYVIDLYCEEKAIYYLRKAENEVRGNPVRLKRLITLYAKLEDSSQMMNLWRIYKDECKAQFNVDYMAMIGSLAKIGSFEKAETIFHEWESSGNSYDFRVPNVLILGYCRKGLMVEAERLLQDIISKGKTPIPNAWSIISSAYNKRYHMDEALICMEKALELVPEHEGWVPHQETLSSILEWLGDEGEIEDVHRFLIVLTKSVPLTQEMCSTLLRAHIRHGFEIGDILERMKAANIDVDEELREKCRLIMIKEKSREKSRLSVSTHRENTLI
ncbi:pentatricopeptide repeat-containing protein At4g21705, mitochondrial-like [Silene latifolia]|uniref:pentatricopeptide repeat-containing protein At4g21705, mitochondrial-like n=1 Tax=Silene latifolia TaxID=37657 RepID=UPI003D775F33